MSEKPTVWMISVPSTVAWAVANAGRRVIPPEDDRLTAGDPVLIRAAHWPPRDYEVLEAYVGRSITDRPRAMVVAIARLDRLVSTVPEEQRRWTSESSWLLTDVRRLTEPIPYRRAWRYAIEAANWIVAEAGVFRGLSSPESGAEGPRVGCE